jgi:hypothetical protein
MTKHEIERENFKKAAVKLMLDISVNELGTFKAHETVFAWLAWQARAELDHTDALIEPMSEVIRISDRQHDAWDATKAAIAQAKEAGY